MTNINRRPRILSVLSNFHPENEATGPVQSLQAFTKLLGDDFDIHLLAVDPCKDQRHHLKTTSTERYSALRPGGFGVRGLIKWMRGAQYDLLMLNSFHDARLVIPILVWRKLGIIPHRPTILSPRGEFASAALSVKPFKKMLYRRFVENAGLTADIWLHATADHERADIEAARLPSRGVIQAPDTFLLPEAPKLRDHTHMDRIRVAFLGRVAPVKNLEFALKVLAKIKVPLDFNIYGPLVDLGYFSRLEEIVKSLPQNINVNFKDTIPHNLVSVTLSRHDLFFFPSKGENFGHAIFEALAAGVPVLISDTTPWRGLQDSGAGWDLPLESAESFVAAIEEVASSTDDRRNHMRVQARLYAESKYRASDLIGAYTRLIDHALNN